LNENTNSNFRRKVEKILDCYSTVDLVEKFLRMYSLLSTEVHNSLHTPEVLVITNKITLKYGKIIGEMCRELNVEFRYSETIGG